VAAVTTRAVHAIIAGSVQGVGFRWFVRERARELNLSGWVRNVRNGDVEIAVSGDAAAVERFLTVVKQGPPRASVTAVRTSDLVQNADLPTPFDIRQ
jgi:acylphosphatase